MTTPNKPTDQPSQQGVTLLPCPFCGAGETHIVENGKMWTGMKYSEPTSVIVRHHCEPIKGQPSRMLERVGKDHESAIAAWNMRSSLSQPPAPEQVSGKPSNRISDHLFIEQRDDGIWLVCVEKVHESRREAEEACQRWRQTMLLQEAANNLRVTIKNSGMDLS